MIKFTGIDKMAFSYTDLSDDQLSRINFVRFSLHESPTIEGVYVKTLTTHVDGRGDLTELWSEPWSKNEPVEEAIKHVYFNTTHEGVIKAWHIHEHTYSQYTCVLGKMQVVLVDVREGSNSYGHVNEFVIGTQKPTYIKIPPGVLKGWKSLRGDSVIVNLLTGSDISDNYKYKWDLILSDIWCPRMG